ncbi:MAG: PQQ-binding-like beta-propeller repeat protein, partial [Chloroflexota bacterium]
DMSGTLLWKRDLGTLDSGYYEVPDAQWGFASSPVIHGDKVIVQCDIQKGSFIAALNMEDGTDIWMTPRKEVPTWSTPAVHNGQVICNGYRHIGGYDLKTGEEVWKLHGGGDIPVPTPLIANDLIYITNGHGFENPVYAINTTAKGKLKIKRDQTTAEHVAYRIAGKGTYMQTPIIVGDQLYLCKDNGVLTCCDAKTGKQIYQSRLGKGLTGFTASPVAADGKVYFTSEDGDVYVVQEGTEFKLLSKNPIGEPSMATPAIANGVILIRGQKHLFAIGMKK